MEKLFRNLMTLLSLCLVMTVISSCGDDDDDDNDDDPALVDVWNGVEFTRSNCDDPDDDGVLELGPGEAVFTFNSDGTYLFVNVEDGGGTDTEVGTYTVSGSSVTICEDGGTDCDTFNWSVSGDMLTITGDDVDEGCSIVAEFESAG